MFLRMLNPLIVRSDHIGPIMIHLPWLIWRYWHLTTFRNARAMKRLSKSLPDLYKSQWLQVGEISTLPVGGINRRPADPTLWGNLNSGTDGSITCADSEATGGHFPVITYIYIYIFFFSGSDRSGLPLFGTRVFWRGAMVWRVVIYTLEVKPTIKIILPNFGWFKFPTNSLGGGFN